MAEGEGLVGSGKICFNKARYILLSLESSGLVGPPRSTYAYTEIFLLQDSRVELLPPTCKVGILTVKLISLLLYLNLWLLY